MHSVREIAAPHTDMSSIALAKPEAQRIAGPESKKHAREVLNHIASAKARRSGKNLSGMTDEELIADLFSCRQGA